MASGTAAWRKAKKGGRVPTAAEILPDALWRDLRPLLPPSRPSRRRPRGRPRLDARRALTGILYMLKSGTSPHRLPLSLGCGSGRTCWRRVKDWRRSGVWDALERVLRERAQASPDFNWSRAERLR